MRYILRILLLVAKKDHSELERCKTANHRSMDPKTGKCIHDGANDSKSATDYGHICVKMDLYFKVLGCLTDGLMSLNTVGKRCLSKFLLSHYLWLYCSSACVVTIINTAILPVTHFCYMKSYVRKCIVKCYGK